MRLLIDSQIPLAEQVFSHFGPVDAVPGETITPAAVRRCEVLLVRSVTRVDDRLLAGSGVRFVGSATAGTDHVDLAYLERQGIAFAHAPGSNAGSVAEYVLAALLAAFADRGRELRALTAGVVGLGQIGSRVAERLEALGMEVLRSDPPLARQDVHGSYHPLSDLLDAADVLTLHVPLTRGGPDATWHLLDQAALERVKPGAWIVNTARGAAVDNSALQQSLASGRLGGAIMDVWEGEPRPSPALIELCTIATPHIAGYSHDGKVEGTLMLAEALARWAGRLPAPGWRAMAAPAGPLRLQPPREDAGETAWLDDVARQMYDVRADSARTLALLRCSTEQRPRLFHQLRATYPERRSFEWYRLAADLDGDRRRAVAGGLRVQLEEPVYRP